MKIFSGSAKSDLRPPTVKSKADIIFGMKHFPHVKTYEVCPECDSEVRISAYGTSLCPECGARIKPCSVCQECQNPCVYDAPLYYGTVSRNSKFGSKGFDPWDGVHVEILFYEVFEEDGRKLARQRNDFFCSDFDKKTPWRMADYSSTAAFDPEDYRRFGPKVVYDAYGPIDVYNFTEEGVNRRYFSLLKQSKYLPLEKVTDATPEGMYWMRYDIPPYSKS